MICTAQQFVNIPSRVLFILIDDKKFPREKETTVWKTLDLKNFGAVLLIYTKFEFSSQILTQGSLSTFS